MSWMNKKNEGGSSTAATTPSTPAASHQSTPAAPRESGTLVNIGKSVHIKGELTGSEDLTIEGRVEGQITLKNHTVRVGESGHIKAEIHAKSVLISGEVVGNVTADDKISVARTGSVEGDITAPRVILEDGSQFQGRIDMPTGGKTAQFPEKNKQKAGNDQQKTGTGS